MKFTNIALVIVFSFTFSWNIANGYDNTTIRFIKTADPEHYRAVADQLRYLEKYLKNGVNSAFKKLMPYVMQFSENIKINVSQECTKNSLALMMGIKNIKPWAFKFFDASGKIPDGLLIGSATAMGHYDQCMGIEVKSTNKKDFGKKLFQGQYCVIEARASLYVKKPKAIYMFDYPPEMKNVIESDSIFAKYARFIYYAHLGGLRIGFCVPSGCSKDDINSVLHTHNPLGEISALSCEIKEKNTYSTSQILVLTYYALIILLVLVASAVDYYISHNNVVVESRAIRYLLAFSFVTNFRTFCGPSRSKDKIQCLDGMKFFGMSWVLIGHSLMTAVGIFTHGILRYEHYTGEMAFQAIINAMFCVDTFFIIGAFLSGYLTTKNVIVGKKKFSILYYVFHRLWRIYPTYIVLLTTALMIPLMNSGPFYGEAITNVLDPCYTHWWANLLFINNFFNPKDACFLHTWYITNDFQLYILSLIVILPLIRWPKVGLSLLALGLVGNILYAFIIAYVNEWPPVMLFTLMDIDESIEYWRYIYYVPWPHFGPYGIGLLTGYIFAMNPNVKMSRRTQVLGWCVAFTCSFSVLYGTRDWYVRPMPPYLAAIYAGFCRTAWSIGPAWIIYACATGHGGIINWILSWRIFTHLGRLTFCAYIVHFIPIVVMFTGVKTRIQADLYIPIWFFFGLMVVSLALAFILHLFVEVPFANLELVFLTPAKKETEKENKSVEEGFKNEKNGDILILTSSTKDESTKI